MRPAQFREWAPKIRKIAKKYARGGELVSPIPKSISEGGEYVICPICGNVAGSTGCKRWKGEASGVNG